MKNFFKEYDKSRISRISYVPKTNFNSKWAHLKILLQNKTSFESSVKLLKKQTLNQFSSKCCEVYKDKIEIFLLTLKNRQIFSFFKKNMQFNYTNVVVKSDIEEICSDSCLKDFLFYFRENNEEMLKLINIVKKEQRQILAPFLCHFFYENFFMESIEQEEIFYIIYLLLEKEIDNLCAPLEYSFLNDSFLADFLLEMGNKNEIKNYIDIILNSIIREIDEAHTAYFSLDIIGNSKTHYNNYIKYKIDNSFFNMKKQNFFENEIFFSQAETTDRLSIKNSSFSKKANSVVINKHISNTCLNFGKFLGEKQKLEPINPEIKYEKIPINQILNKNFFNPLNENYLRSLFENEKNELMKRFYIKQLKQIKYFNEPNLYNCRNYYYEKMVKTDNISKRSIKKYNKGYKLITDFIDKLLLNLENKVIIPYNIKIICKLIYLLVQKKYKKISEMQIIILVCRFLFDKLIMPILENPDSSNIAKMMMISLDLRKTLFNVSLVLKKLINGELFYEEKYENYNIFNNYIIENYHRLNNIIKNFIDVKIPNKISLLLDKFYENEDFSLNDRKLESSEINYDYFKENPSEFMQHDSICFNLDQFFLLYDIVNNNKNIFIKEGTPFAKIFNNLSKYVPCFEKSNTNYYVIIKENYSQGEKDLLFHEEKMIGLSKSKTPEELLFKLKFCITYLLSQIEFPPQSDWILGNYDTKKTFNFINKYLTIYEKKSISRMVPLNWYSKYILNNLHLINECYKENDYELLYREIEDNVYGLIDKLNELNEFLTVNIRTKFVLIENRKKDYKKELIEMEKTELNIRTLFFIESAEINVCFIDGEKYNKLQKKFIFESENQVDKKAFVLSSLKSCPHKQMQDSEINKLKTNGQLSQFHCSKIKEFAIRFSLFHRTISEEIVNYYFSSSTSDKNANANSNCDLNGKKPIITKSPKELLDAYMNYVSTILEKHPIFNKKSYYINDNSEKKFKEKQEKDKEKVLKLIWNYILKSLCIKIYNANPLFIDEVFKIRCISLSSFVKPHNLKISKEFFDENLLNRVKYHLNEMDKKRTPGGMNHEFGMAVQLISALYIFYLNQTQTEAGDLLPFIIYGMISIKPTRIIFNICFSKFFLSENELLGSIGYNMIQAESAIRYINKLDAKELGLTEEEFNKNLSKIQFQK